MAWALASKAWNRGDAPQMAFHGPSAEAPAPCTAMARRSDSPPKTARVRTAVFVSLASRAAKIRSSSSTARIVSAVSAMNVARLGARNRLSPGMVANISRNAGVVFPRAYRSATPAMRPSPMRRRSPFSASSPAIPSAKTTTPPYSELCLSGLRPQ